MQLLAPAKVNLTLLVKGRREDGFHEIESLLCPISLFDTLEITVRESGALEFVCDDPTIPADDTNLVVRAARLFCSSCGLNASLHIELAKRIPHGAGLGGGSSDAAATLFGLDRLFQTSLTMNALTAMAAELGSDVPFFLHHSAARIGGRGERVEPVTFSQKLPLLLVKPPFGVPTPWAYRRWKGARQIPGVRYTPQEFPWGTLQNDLERPVFEKFVFLAALKSWLLAQPESAGALLSGSGSTVFAVLREVVTGPALAERTLAEFGPNLWCCLAETVT